MRKSPAPRPSTADRVLDTTLDLLNRLGTAQVTTRGIANAAGINEGNLYYHFRTREALLTALFARFEAASLQAMRADGAEPAAYAAMLDRWFALAWEYRFLFRDALAIQAEAPRLRRALRRLSLRLMEETGQVVAAMERDGQLRIPPEARDRLLANVAIVSSYWVSFLGMQRGLTRLTRAHMDWGRAQVRALYAPYLVAATADRPGPPRTGSPAPPAGPAPSG